MKILIAGIGDLLRRDDGFGPTVIKKLEKLELPDNIVVKDYGTASLDLIFELEDFDEAIIVDVLDFDGKVGEVRIVKPKSEKLSKEEVVELTNMSLHEIELQKMIDLACSLNVLPKKLLIVGCKPKDLDFGLGLSEEVEKAVKRTVKIVLEKIYGRLK